MHSSQIRSVEEGESGWEAGRRDPLPAGSGGSDRRRFLRLCGTTLLAGAAGCTDTGGDADGGGSSGQESDNETAPEPALGVSDATVSETEIYLDETLEITGTIENEGDAEGTFYAELRIDGTIIETKEVTVGAGETESVTFSGTFGEPGEYEVGVNDVRAGTVVVERRPPEFEIRDASIEKTTIAVGEEVEVQATVANVGGREGTFTAELQVDGLSVETQDVTIAAGNETAVPFGYAFESPGRYEVSVNDVAVDAVTVAPPAEFEVTATAIERTTARIGENVEVRATIANVGGLEGTVTATLEEGGEPIATREVTIPSAETETVRFSVGFEERGAYALSVNGVDVDTLYVTECYVPVDERVTVDSRSSKSYSFDLKERVDVTIRAETRDGVAPTLTVVGPSSTLVDGTKNDSIDGTVTTETAGSHEIRFENDAFLPWRSGTWDIEIEICTW